MCHREVGKKEGGGGGNCALSIFSNIFLFFIEISNPAGAWRRKARLSHQHFGVISLGSYAVFNKCTFFQEKEKQDALKVKQEKEELLKKADSQSCIEAQR